MTCSFRDRLVLNALYLTPLTIDQLLELSRTWPQPFPSWKTLYRRMTVLKRAGLVQSWRYAFASRGSPPSYFRLTLTGYRMLRQDRHARPPTGFPLQRIGPALHLHTYALSRFVVCILRAAHRHGVLVTNCHPENTVPINGDGPILYPDFLFSLRTAAGDCFSFCVELDNGTEPIVSRTSRDSLLWKMRRYEERHYESGGRFRVLFVTTRSFDRVRNIVHAAGESVLEPRRSIFLSTTLDNVLRSSTPLTSRVFRDQQGRGVALIPGYRPRSRIPVELPVELLARPYPLA